MTVQTQFSSDPNTIVDVIVRTIQAPTPNSYQQTGCLISLGATSLDAQDTVLLTQYSDLGLVSPVAVKITDFNWATATLTLTCANGNFEVGQPTEVAIRGFVSMSDPPVVVDGSYSATIIDPTHISVPFPEDPGSALSLGTVQPVLAVELDQMARTFFGQGPGAAVYVLELGVPTDVPEAIGALNTWLVQNPRTFYGYLLPRSFTVDQDTTDLFTQQIAAMYNNPEAMTYFWMTNGYGVTVPPETKCVIQFAEAASVDPVLGYEFSAAAMFFNAISFKPTAVTPCAPMAFKYLYGVTPMETKNNGASLFAYKQQHVNYVAKGSEGGVDFYMVYQGVTADDNDYFNWWFTIDWVQININLDVSNAVINGSNNPLAPLYYDQDGINVLLSVLAGTMTRGVQLGMVLGRVVQTELDPGTLQRTIYAGTFAGQCDCNAVPFLTYTQMNPSDYKEGEYDGLSTIFIPRRGFIHILITVVASQIVTL
jgi:hypothetical protein